MEAVLEPCEKYQTENLSLCAFLLMEGHPCVETVIVGEFKRRNGSSVPKRAMVFEATETLYELVDEFMSGSAQVEPLTFQSKIAFARNLLMGKDGD